MAGPEFIEPAKPRFIQPEAKLRADTEVFVSVGLNVLALVGLVGTMIANGVVVSTVFGSLFLGGSLGAAISGVVGSIRTRAKKLPGLDYGLVSAGVGLILSIIALMLFFSRANRLWL